jgi:hypothetical protein
LGKSGLSTVIAVAEKTIPQSKILNQLYSFTLGVYLQKGYRQGIKKYSSKN